MRIRLHFKEMLIIFLDCENKSFKTGFSHPKNCFLFFIHVKINYIYKMDQKTMRIKKNLPDA